MMSVFLASMEGQRNVVWLRCQPTTVAVNHRNLGGTPSGALLSQSLLPQSRQPLTIHDDAKAVDDASQACKSQFPSWRISIVVYCIDFCILHPLVVAGFFPDLHKSVVTSRY